jgi:DNA-binding PadR family transcriptional regulator
MQGLTPTARVILGLIGLGARTGYEVKQYADISTRFFWGASYGQIYPELRRLEAAGLVAGEDDARGGVRKRAYRLTGAGERVLHTWLVADAPSHFSLRDEGLLRVFFGDLLSDEELVAAVRKLRDEHALRLERFRAIESRVAEDAWDSTVLALEYGIAFLEWNVRWWSDAERRLRARARRAQRERRGAPDRR